MQLLAKSAVLSSVALVAATAAQTTTGQVCPGASVNRFESCVCPPGTEFQISTLYAILGVNAKDFNNHTSDCVYRSSIAFLRAASNRDTSVYNVAWQGITNVTKSGPDNAVGSLRTFPEGTLSITEQVRSCKNFLLGLSDSDEFKQLDSFQSLDDGSYLARFSQYNVPVEYPSGNGSYSGYWITFDAEYAAEYETNLKWEIYACFTGHPFDFAESHSSDLNNLLATMQKAGLVKGNITEIYTVQAW